MKYHNKLRLLIGGVGMLVLIFDSRTALYGMSEGVKLCLYTLIPSLYPFIVLGTLISEATVGTTITILRPITKIFRIPEGTESLLMVGWLGGYPIGAQSVAAAYHKGHLNRSEAERLAIICNNPGPAFLFGVLGSVFSSPKTLWLLWGIQIFTSLLISLLIPGSNRPAAPISKRNPTPFPEILTKSALSMLNICACVVFFRTVLEFLQRWILWAVPEVWSVMLSGMLELSNGCILLSTVTDSSIRPILASGLLCFGGFCVRMQTGAVCPGMQLGQYLLWKTLQGFLCATITAYFVLPHRKAAYLLPAVIAVAYFLFRRKEKDIAFGRGLLYNSKNAA